MTTSEQARAWAKAEAEKRFPFDITDPDRDPFYATRRAAAEWAFLHVLSLLESEQAVEAGADALAAANDLAWDRQPGDPSDVYARDARAALAAVVAAITNQETGGSGS